MRQSLPALLGLLLTASPGASGAEVVEDDVFLVGPHPEGTAVHVGDRQVLTTAEPPLLTVRYGADTYATERSWRAVVVWGQTLRAHLAWQPDTLGVRAWSSLDVMLTHNGGLVDDRHLQGWGGALAWELDQPGEYVLTATGRLAVTHVAVRLAVA